MLKYFCDVCGEELLEKTKYCIEIIQEDTPGRLPIHQYREVCGTCATKVGRLLNDLRGAEGP